MDGSQGRPEGQKNVLGGALQSCSEDPVTGFVFIPCKGRSFNLILTSWI